MENSSGADKFMGSPSPAISPQARRSGLWKREEVCLECRRYLAVWYTSWLSCLAMAGATMDSLMASLVGNEKVPVFILMLTCWLHQGTLVSMATAEALLRWTLAPPTLG